MKQPTYGYVSVHALSAGYLTLPEHLFVSPAANPPMRHTVPSLSFLIQHTNPVNRVVTRIVFDLGIRRQLYDYAEPIQKHIETRQPISGDPGSLAALARGGLGASDIDMIMFSHLHWDHIGTPSDFPFSTYVIGPGAGSLIFGPSTTSSSPGPHCSHAHFERGLLDQTRTIELPPLDGTIYRVDTVNKRPGLQTETARHQASLFTKPWCRKAPFDAAIDVFGDGSLYIVSAPGHLDSHINLLCRLEGRRYVYLAGDACHDPRIISGKKEIATWAADPDCSDGPAVLSIHQDVGKARETLEKIRNVASGVYEKLGAVEVVLAHDAAWAEAARKRGRFFPGQL